MPNNKEEAGRRDYGRKAHRRGGEHGVEVTFGVTRRAISALDQGIR